MMPIGLNEISTVEIVILSIFVLVMVVSVGFVIYDYIEEQHYSGEDDDDVWRE